MGVQRAVRDDVALARVEGEAGPVSIRTGAVSLRHHALRAVGTALGSRADRLPARITRACSLERRAGFDLVAERG